MIDKIQQTILNRLHGRGLYTDKYIKRVQNVLEDYGIPKESYRTVEYEQVSPFKEYKVVFNEGLSRQIKDTLQESEEYKVEELEDAGRFRVLRIEKEGDDVIHRNLGSLVVGNNTVYLDFVTRIEAKDFEASPQSQKKLEIFEAHFNHR